MCLSKFDQSPEISPEHKVLSHQLCGFIHQLNKAHEAIYPPLLKERRLISLVRESANKIDAYLMKQFCSLYLSDLSS